MATLTRFFKRSRIGSTINRSGKRKARSNRQKRSRFAGFELLEPRQLLAATVFSDGFEGSFPGPWVVGNNGGTTTAHWGDNYAKAAAGSWSAFCADNGSNSRTTYDHNLNTYMQRQNVSLVGYNTATLTFRLWLNSEPGYDTFQVNVYSPSTGWVNKLSQSGNQSSWATQTINMDQFAGQSGITVSFDFVSDGSVVPSGDAGAWVDEVVLTADSTWPQWPSFPFSSDKYENTVYVNQDGNATIAGKSLTAGDYDGYHVFWDDSGSATVQTAGSTDTRMAYYQDGTPNPDLTDDDSGAGTNSLITTNIPNRENLGYSVAGYGANTTGNYDLSVDGPAHVGTQTISLNTNNDGTTTGTIDHEFDYDFYTFTVPSGAGGSWTVTVDPTGSLDPMLLVFNSAGNPVAGSFTAPIDAGASGTNETWTATMSAGEQYFIRVDGFSSSTGDYTVIVDGPMVWPQWPAFPFAGNDYENTVYVNQDGNATLDGKSLTAGDLDGYHVFWDNAGSATVQTSGSTDTRLGYYQDGTPNPDLTDDDSGVDTNALITASVPSWERLGYAALGFSSTTAGNYGLSVDGPAAGTELIAPSGSANIGQTTGWVDHEFDYDFYQFTVNRAGTWTVTVDPVGSLDPMLLVFDSGGNPVGGSFTAPIDAGASGSNEIWTGTNLAINATYYIRVDGFTNSTGDFTLIVDGPDEAWPVWPGFPFAGDAYENTVYVNQDGNATIAGKSLTAGDYDGYHVFWDDPGSATVQTAGSIDTRLAFYQDGAPNPDLTDDDSGVDNNALITTSVPNRENLGYSVAGYLATTTGNYDLNVDGPAHVGTQTITPSGPDNIGQTTGTIDHEFDYDFYQFTANASGAWTVTVDPTGSWDPMLLVFDSSGNPVGGSFTAPIDVGFSGDNEQWSATLSPGATYFIRVDGFSSLTGDYTVIVDGPIVEHVFPFSGTDYENTVYVNQDGNATLGGKSLTADDFDGYHVFWDDPGSATVQTTGSTDTLLGYYQDGAPNPDLTDDDSGVDANALITTSIPNRQVLGYAVTGFGGSTGDYGLSVDGPAHVGTGTIALDANNHGTATSTIDHELDYDFYQFTVGASGTWTVTVDPTGSWDPMLLVFNSSGSPVGGSFTAPIDVGFSGDNEQWSAPLSPGTYFIRVDGFSTATGEYTVIVDGVIQNMPDLQGLSADVPAQLAWGQSFTLQGQVRNAGNSAVTTDFRQDFYLSNDETWGDSDDVFLGSYSHTADVPANGQGASFNVNLSLPATVPTGWWGAGTVYVGMVTDATNAVAESNESNNWIWDSTAVRLAANGTTTRYALLIGVADYPGTANDLNYTDDDANDVEAALLARSEWSPSRIVKLIDSAATRAAIEGALLSFSRAVDADDQFLFFDSSHGSNVTDVAPIDEADGLDETLYVYDGNIRDDELGDWLGRMSMGSVVVAVDTCYSGGMAKTPDAAGKGLGESLSAHGDGLAQDLSAVWQATRDPNDRGNSVILTACDENELSVEYSDLQNGVFTYYLVEGMAGPADANANGWISAEEAHNYLYPRVVARNPSQHPQIGDAYSGQLDFLSAQDTDPPTVESFSPADNATSVAVGTNLVIDFNENVRKGSGNIVIRKSSDDSVFETIAVTSSRVTIANDVATIDPSLDFAGGTGYYVRVDAGAFEDPSGNDWAGISNTTTWNFTTASSQSLVDITIGFKDAAGNPISSIPAGGSFRIYVYAQDLRTTGADVGVLSAFADVLYNTSLINVASIVPIFNDFTTGAIDDPAGIVDEVGGLENTRPANRDPQPVFYLNATATGIGTLTVSTNAGESVFSENQLFGVDGDLRNQTRYGSASIAIGGQPDLVGVALNAQSDHVLAGQTTLTFTVRNQGQGNAGAFDVRVVLSDDATVGSADDAVVTTVSFASLAAGASEQRTVSLSLPVPTLFTRAINDDPLGQGGGFRSTSVEHVGIVIDPGNTVTEDNESNNANLGKGVDKDDVTYFPWDTNANGAVTPTDAGFVINRLGQLVPPADARADLNGSGAVTPTDAGAAIGRIGYLRNDSVIEAGGTSAAAVSAEPEPRSENLIGITVRFTDATGAAITQLAEGAAFRIYVDAQDLRTTGTSVGVLSAFADLAYDTSLIDVTAITYLFNDFSTGTLNDAAGVVDEAGGLENTVPPNRNPQPVFYLDAVATGAGQLTVSSNVGESVFSENQLFGVDGDLRAQTAYGSGSIPIAPNVLPGIIVTPVSGLLTTEAGGAATFSLVLATQPSANVTIGLSSSDLTEGTVSPASVTFTPSNWNVAQQATVTGVNDSVADGPVSYTIITAAATSSDANYNGLNAADVAVTNQDDEPPPPAIDVELVITATASAQDLAATLPASLPAVRTGGTFFVEVWAKNVDASPHGITGGYLDFAFDRTLMTAGSVSHGGIYTGMPSGSVNNATGLVDDLGGNAGPGVIDKGDDEWVRLGYVEFTANQVGNASFTAAPGIDKFARAGEGVVPWNTVELNTPPVNLAIARQCIYDVDADQYIGTGDYSFLSNAWHASPGGARWDQRVDFDRDNYIGTGDYSWFSLNWHKNANDPSILYPPGVLALGDSSTAGSKGAAIDVELVPVASPSAADTAADLPARTESVVLDDTFYVEVWVRNADASPNGITGGYLDFSFDSSLVTGGSIDHGALYTELSSGAVNGALGVVDDLGGNTALGVTDKGNDEWVRLGYVSFTAATRGVATFSASAGGDQFARAGEGAIAWPSVELNNPLVSVEVKGYDMQAEAPPGSAPSKLLLRLAGADVQLVNQAKNQILFSQPQTRLNSFTVVGAENRADTLTVDFGPGGPVDLPGGVIFNGGAGSRADVLVIRGLAGPDRFAVLADRVVLDGAPLLFTATEQVRLEGMGGDDTYALSDVDVPMTISDTAGIDTLDCSGVATGVTVNLGNTRSSQQIYSGAEPLSIKNTLENVIGTPGDDTITGNSAANRIQAGGGNDTVRGGGGNDWLFGDDGNDSLYGEAGNDVILGGVGNDMLEGGPGRNLLIGGDGEDILRGSTGDTILIGGRTVYDANDVALAVIMAEWSSKRSFQKRCDNLDQGIGDPKLGLVQLKKGITVLDDDAPAHDQLFGGRGGDWFFDFSPPDEVVSKGPKDR